MSLYIIHILKTSIISWNIIWNDYTTVSFIKHMSKINSNQLSCKIIIFSFLKVLYANKSQSLLMFKMIRFNVFVITRHMQERFKPLRHVGFITWKMLRKVRIYLSTFSTYKFPYTWSGLKIVQRMTDKIAQYFKSKVQNGKRDLWRLPSFQVEEATTESMFVTINPQTFPISNKLEDSK